jgi:hypothetical protein
MMAKANHPRPMTIGKTILRHTMAVFASLLLAGQVWADAAGTELAQRVYDRPDGEDATYAITMTLTEKGRSPRVRKMILYRLDKKAGEVSTLIRFTEPADIEGTGLLTQDRADSDSNQWIYLPAMERVRRIDSNRKGGRFVNSDYYYEDLRDRQVGKDQHRIIGKESVAGVNCEILESIPTEAGNSVYAKRISWIDPVTLLPMRVDFFEKRLDQPSKRLLVTKQEKIQGYSTVVDSTLTDLGNGHETRLTLDRTVYDRHLPTKLFTSQVLEDKSAEKDYRP